MLIYNKEWIDNFEIRKKASVWLKKNFISKEEHLLVFQNYQSGYHESNVFVRIGLFIFTLVVIGAGVSLFNLVAFSSQEFGISIQCIFFGGLYYFAAEYFTREKKYFRSGVTDALVYSSAFSISSGVILLLSGKDFDFNLDPIVYITCVLPILIFISIRFRDAFLALLCYAGIFTLNFLLVLKFGITGKLLLPFESMIFSFIAYKVIRSQIEKNEIRFWKNCLLILEAASLVTFYLSGNYFVVRELSVALLANEIGPMSDIHFAYFFYAFTIAVPLIYVWLGLKRKDHLLIRLGGLLAVAGILSIRYYYSIMPAESAMILGGIFLVAIAWVSINYLKIPRNGISYLADDEMKDESFEAIGSVIISQATVKSIPVDQGTNFGGGSSGGGGAGSEF